MLPASSAVGGQAQFDEAVGAVHLPFPVAHMDFLRPTLDTWQDHLKAFHEWVHFYQFASTSYGIMYRAATMAQVLAVARLLRFYEPAGGRCRLPLTSNNIPSLITLGQGPESVQAQWQTELRLVQLLEEYRTTIYGYRVAKPQAAAATEPERRLFLMVLQEEVGLPPLLFVWPHEWLPDEAAAINLIDTKVMLESHAHALAGLWMIQAVERFHLPDELREKALAYTDRLAKGPYGRFLGVKAEPEYLLHTICTLCDLALNPPGFTKWPPQTTTVMFDTTWAPVSRLLHLLALHSEGRLPHLSMSRAGWQLQFLQELHGTLDSGWDQYFPPYDRVPWNGAQGLVSDIVGKVLGSIDKSFLPPVAALYLEDWFQSYAAVDLMRSSIPEPLLLAGNSIEDLERLVATAGAPTVLVRQGQSDHVFPRWCTGLAHAGYLKAQDPTWNDTVVGAGLGWMMALRCLLNETKRELVPTLHAPLHAGVDLTLADVLGWYGRRLDDFD